MNLCKKLFALTLAALIAALPLSGCVKRDSSGSSSSGPAASGSSTAGGSSSGVTELYIYSSKGEVAQQLEAVAQRYSEETGIKIKTFSIGSGQDHMETLRAEMQGDISAQPAIFTIQGLKELIEWQDSGKALNFSDLPEGPFKELADAIPQNLRLTSDGTDSYGIPYNVEGYGYILDTQMLSDLVDGDQASVYADLVASSYDEFAAFVEAVSTYIASPSTASFTLNGNEYAFRAAKTGLAANLTGVFAVAGAEKWTYGDHMINVAINAVFPSANAANSATDEQLDALRGPFAAFARALDLKTSHAAGTDGPAVRGSDFIVSTTTDYNATLQKFVDGKALFMKNGNWVASNIEALDENMAARLVFVPVKLPITQEDIQVEGLTVEAFNSSIPVFVPMYYAINAQKDEATIQAAQDFLVWLNTSEEGRAAVVEQLQFIPYNADPAETTLQNALGNSILNFMKAGAVLSDPYNGAPANWGSSTVGQEIMEKYLTKETWTEEDYNSIADYAISKWKEMKAQ